MCWSALTPSLHGVGLGDGWEGCGEGVGGRVVVGVMGVEFSGRAPDSWSEGRGIDSRQERRENLLLQGSIFLR